MLDTKDTMVSKNRPCSLPYAAYNLVKEKNINMWLPLAHPPLGTWPATQACALTGN